MKKPAWVIRLTRKMRGQQSSNLPTPLSTNSESFTRNNLPVKTGVEHVSEFLRSTEPLDTLAGKECSAAAAIKRASDILSPGSISESEIAALVELASIQRTEAVNDFDIPEAAKRREKQLNALCQAITGIHNYLFKNALLLCVNKRRASTAVLQSEFDIGLEDAVELLDRMTEQGFIGPAKGSKPRPLLNLAYETVALWQTEEELATREESVSCRDELFDDALRICVEMKRASTSVLQRRLRIGYGRAAAILDAMERDGYIGQAVGAQPRPVLGRAYETVSYWDDVEMT